MEQTGKAQKKIRESRVIIRAPVRLAIFSGAILVLGALALGIIADAAPIASASLY